MLKKAGSPMRRSLPLAAHMPAPPLKSLLALVLFACAASCPWVSAQSSGGAPAAPAADPSISAGGANSTRGTAAPATGVPTARFNMGSAAFGLPQSQPPNPFRSTNAITVEWNSSVPGPFQTGASFGSSGGFPGSGRSFNGTADDFGPVRLDESGLDAGWQGSGISNRFDNLALGGHQPNVAPLFPMNGSFTSGQQGGAVGPFAATPGALPSLNQLMRGSLSQPFNTSFGTLRPTYQGTFRPVGGFNDSVNPSGSVLFTSPDLGNGVFLSAGTGYGSHSMAGAPAASVGNGTGGPKHSGTAVNLKLSF
jgi:hypothetical protein